MKLFAETAASLLESRWNDVRFLNFIAWSIAAEQTGPERDLALAEKAARQACKLTNDKDGAILDTLAHVYFAQDQLEKAVEWQKKAVAASPENADLAETLQSYDAKLKPAAQQQSDPAIDNSKKEADKAEAAALDADGKSTPDNAESPSQDSDACTSDDKKN